MARPAIISDKHLDPEIGSVLTGWSLLAATKLRTRLPYVGNYPDDEDHSEVLQLAWENEATLITSDSAMLEKAYEFGRCGSYGRTLRGVLILPVGKNQQIEKLTDFVEGRLPVLGIDPEAPMQQIYYSNLGVNLTLRQPQSWQLCDCPYELDKLRMRKRYKLN